jgi:1-acyl-sn-glycerol-3-phosphate acyltransferase
VRALRIARLALHVARGLFIAAFLFPFEGRARRDRAICAWARRLLAVASVRLHVHGRLDAARPLMIVANHVSWLDIFAIQALHPVRFVAKSEVRGWPLLGWLSEKAGTLFIEQSKRRETHRINGLIAESLKSGEVFGIFPEGTTTDGSRLLKFHASLLAPAAAVGAAVQPVAIRYEREDGTLCTEAAFDGERSLWATVLGISTQRRIDVHVWFGTPLETAPRHRREVAEAAREIIRRRLRLDAPSSRSETDGDLRAAAR